jgi:hypothetical protein
MQCFPQILFFEIRVGRNYLVLSHAISNHADDRRDRDP